MNRTFIVYLVSFAAFLGPFSQNIYTPILPEVTAVFHTSPFWVNVSISIFTFFMALMQFVYGPLTDSKGRRKVILFGIALYILATCGCFFAHSIGTLVMFRALQAIGIASGSVVAATVIGDLFGEKSRGKAMGTFQMMVALGPVAGPVIGGFLGGRFDFHSVFLALMAMGALVWVFHFAFLKETKSASGGGSRFQFRNFYLILKDRMGSSVILLGFAQNYAYYNFMVFMPGILSERYGLTAEQKGLVFVPMALSIVVGSFLGGRIQERIEGKKVIVLTSSLNVLSVFFFLAVFGFSLALLITGTVLFGLFMGMSLPVQTTLLTQRFQTNRATAVGVYNFFRYMGMTAGPIAGSLLHGIGGYGLSYGFVGFFFLLATWAAGKRLYRERA